MRQISTSCAKPLRRASTGQPCPRPGARDRAAFADRAEARRPPRRRAPGSFARSPTARSPASSFQLGRLRHRCTLQHDLRSPPRPARVALGFVDDQAGGLEVVEPALHAAPVRADEPLPLDRIARDRTPADHRRQPCDELRDRGRVAGGTRRMTEPEQVALDRVGARLQAVIARRAAPARSPRPGQQRDDHVPPGLRRQRLDRRPIPTTRRDNGCAVQRHRQRPRTSRQQEALRSRTDARGTAGWNPASARDRDPREGVGYPSGARLELLSALSYVAPCGASERRSRRTKTGPVTRSLSFSGRVSAARGSADVRGERSARNGEPTHDQGANSGSISPRTSPQPLAEGRSPPARAKYAG